MFGGEATKTFPGLSFTLTAGGFSKKVWPRLPTAVMLRGFVARPTRQGVELRWRTAQETGLLGFDLYRADVKLNRTPIPARGSGAAGAAYRLLDRGARVGSRSTYRLQAVRADGTRAWIGRAAAKR